jgi:hypothetical protein
MDRFLGIGINSYPDAPLRGCVPDIRECANRLYKYGLTFRNMDVMSDENTRDARCTRLAIWRRLDYMVNQSIAGDQLLFWYSGHGAQIPLRNTGEVDGMIECLCPVDFSFDDQSTWIKDKDLIEVLKRLNGHNIYCTVVLDSCFSGGMTDLATPRMKRDNTPWENDRPRAYPIERNLAFDVRMKSAKEKGIKAVSFAKSVINECENVCFLLGCREDQTCADAYIPDIGFRGAFSFYLWRSLAENPQLSCREVIEITREKLESAGFSQTPEIYGPDELILKPFMRQP